AHVLQRYKGEGVVKLYTSGSFLDPAEIPEPQRLLDKVIEAGARRVVVESRPEYIAPSLERVKQYEGHIEVALGLETSSDILRERAVCKGFTFEDYSAAAAHLRDAGARVRTYLLLKPPFLTERDALLDCVRSMRDAAPHSHVLSINPVNVQRGTLVERLWRRGAYRPPWLWTLLEVLRRGREILPGDVLLVSEPSGGGTRRGAHNCMGCDRRILDAVRRFSLSQDSKALHPEHCGCIETWLDILELEPAAFTTTDLLRAERG
ncbi:MAG: archaeosine biosynthesis radical SAM protein RaSEA, partial [Candidatus Thermoplasmatota archaeon]